MGLGWRVPSCISRNGHEARMAGGVGAAREPLSRGPRGSASAAGRSLRRTRLLHGHQLQPEVTRQWEVGTRKMGGGELACPNSEHSPFRLENNCSASLPGPVTWFIPGQGAQQEDTARQAALSCRHRGPPRGTTSRPLPLPPHQKPCPTHRRRVCTPMRLWLDSESELTETTEPSRAFIEKDRAAPDENPENTDGASP